MSEVVALAAIAGAVSIVTSVIGALSTWSVSKHSSVVRLAEIDAQTGLMQEGIRQRERCRRLAVYQQLANVFHKMYNTFGNQGDHERGERFSDDYIPVVANVMLVGAAPVCEVAGEANAIFDRLWSDLEAKENEPLAKSRSELWCEVTGPIKEELREVGPKLMSRMHDDVARGITEDDPLTNR